MLHQFGLLWLAALRLHEQRAICWQNRIMNLAIPTCTVRLIAEESMDHQILSHWSANTDKIPT